MYSEKLNRSEIKVHGYKYMTCLKDSENYRDCISLEITFNDSVRFLERYYSYKTIKTMVGRAKRVIMQCPLTRKNASADSYEQTNGSQTDHRFFIEQLREAALFRHMEEDRIKSLKPSSLYYDMQVERSTEPIPDDFFDPDEEDSVTEEIDVNDSDSVDYLNLIAAVEIVDLHLNSDSDNAIFLTMLNPST